MGWIKRKTDSMPAGRVPPTKTATSTDTDPGASSLHIQACSAKDSLSTRPSTPTKCDLQTTPPQKYPFASPTTKTPDLHFIATAEVLAKRSTGTKEGHSDDSSALWIVIDGVVFDCSSYVSEHPGGEAVMRSFAGCDCSWQFWRFHGKEDMETWGRPLRVGRSEGVGNPFVEPVRFVGLRRMGEEEW